MRYSLDANVVIAAMRKPYGALVQHLRAQASGSLVVCAVVRSEMFYGAMKSQHPARNLNLQREFLASFPGASFDDSAAEAFGEIRADLERQGKPIGPYDMQIAAIALANDLTLVTHNTREFSRIRGLKRVDWQK